MPNSVPLRAVASQRRRHDRPEHALHPPQPLGDRVAERAVAQHLAQTLVEGAPAGAPVGTFEHPHRHRWAHDAGHGPDAGVVVAGGQLDGSRRREVLGLLGGLGPVLVEAGADDRPPHRPRCGVPAEWRAGVEQLVPADSDELGGGADADEMRTDRGHALDRRGVGLDQPGVAGHRNHGPGRARRRRAPLHRHGRHALGGERLVEGRRADGDDRLGGDQQVGDRAHAWLTALARGTRPLPAASTAAGSGWAPWPSTTSSSTAPGPPPAVCGCGAAIRSATAAGSIIGWGRPTVSSSSPRSSTVWAPAGSSWGPMRRDGSKGTLDRTGPRRCSSRTRASAALVPPLNSPSTCPAAGVAVSAGHHDRGSANGAPSVVAISPAASVSVGRPGPTAANTTGVRHLAAAAVTASATSASGGLETTPISSTAGSASSAARAANVDAPPTAADRSRPPTPTTWRTPIPAPSSRQQSCCAPVPDAATSPTGPGTTTLAKPRPTPPRRAVPQSGPMTRRPSAAASRLRATSASTSTPSLKTITCRPARRAASAST